MRRTHRLPARFIRWISLSVCFALLLTSLAMFPLPLVKGRGSTQNQNNQGTENGKSRKVKAEPPRRGAPAATMPDLDEAKRKRDPEPAAPAPIPSTVRSKRKPLESRRGRKVGDPLPPKRRASTNETRDSERVSIASADAHDRVGTVRSHHARTTRSLAQAVSTDVNGSQLVARARADGRVVSRRSAAPLSHPALNVLRYSAFDFLHKPNLNSYDQTTAVAHWSLLFLALSKESIASDASFDLLVAPIPQAGSSRILFTSNRDGSTQIYVMNADGSAVTRLTYNSANDDNPRWSANGSKILFQSDRDNPSTGYMDIYVMNPDGSGQTRLTSDANDDCAPIWSPDGTKIAFQSFRNGVNYQVYVMNADGSGQVNVSNSTANDTQPSWSPDGAKIAFASDRDHAGLPSVYVMNANGTNQTRLTFSGSGLRDEQPVWSPNAAKLAFVSTRDSILETWQETDDFEIPEDDGQVITKSRLHINKEVYVMNADGSGQFKLTNDLANDDSPRWSPDGTKIVFRSDRERECCDPSAQVWTMNPDGSNQTLVSSNQFGDYSPSWGSTSNQSPIASAGGPYSGVTSQTINFNGSGSFDSDGSIVSYAWSFGDGGTGSGLAPTHAYSAAGTYNVTLTVTDNLGAQGSTTTTANISVPSNNQFVQGFYQWALLRQPSGEELSYWTDIMRSAYPQGQTSMLMAMREFGMTVFESAEYAARNRSNHDYVYDLYKTYLMREPDQQGWEYWIASVPLYGREHVRRGFDESTEFINLVSTLSVSGSPSSSVSSLITARVDPFNQPGSGLLARDAEWSVPLVSLPGRAGLDLGLSLSYSSMVWTRSGPYLYFDEDNGSLGPGFRLGFPTIQEKFFDAQVGRNVYLLRMPGGGRVELRQVGSSNVYEAADSSYLQLIEGGSLLLRTTDGTQLTYWWFNHEFRCVEIKDRNGNYLNASYDWRGDIQNVTDTLGRVITFNYDGNVNLSTITQSWAINGVAQTHTWATFGWGTLTMQPSFSGASVVGTYNGEAMPVLTQVGLGDGSYFTFQYTGVGQVNVIRRYRSDNVQRSYTTYDYNNASDDCPRLSQTRVWAENWTGVNGVPAEVVTQYSGEPTDTWRQLIAPDNTIYKEFYGTGWQKGLTTQSEVWSGGVRQKWTTTAWTQDNTNVNYQTNPRVTETNIYDSSGNRRRTVIDYGQYAQYGLPYLVKEYAADGVTDIRRSFTDYNLSPAYLERRIIGLVSETHLFDPIAGQWKGKVFYGYDDPTKIQSQATTATQHDQSYSALFTTRGNVTSVSRWDVADLDNATKVLTTQVGYNAAGSVLTTADPLAHQSSISYADSFSDSINHNSFAYPTTVTDPDGFSSKLQYNYDFGGKTRAQGPPPAGQSQGVIQTLAYDSAARIQQVTTTNTGAYKRYIYGPNYVESFGSANNVADDAYAIQVFDGAHRVIGAAKYHPGSAGGYSMVNTIYDRVGRAVRQSNPTEINGSWVPSGDDAGGLVYTEQTYDWKGRPLETTHLTDGTVKYASYGGCGCAGGEVVTLTDEVGRQQKSYSDGLGRAWKTEVLNDDDSVYSTVANAYNARDQVTLVRQYQGAEGSGVYQDTTMTYDGYGRLMTKHVPEQDAGAATVFSYNTDDTINSVTDARGASATYSYNARRLVNGISYSAPAGITPAANVSFAYDAVGNRTSMTDGRGSQSYAYDQLSRMISETRTFNGVGTFTLNYQYNLAGQLASLTDPFNAQVGYSYDNTGRLSAISGAGFASVSSYASNFQYRAWGAVKHLSYGNGVMADMNFNGRLQTTHFTTSGVMSKDYQYYDDGRLSFLSDLMNSKFDRSYRYDYVGHMSQALSGAEAHGGGPTSDRPYNQSFGYDAFGHLASRTSKNWTMNLGTQTDSYLNNRHAGWLYDAEGNLRSGYTYDASGEIATVNLPGNDTHRGMDGNGQQVKTVETETILEDTITTTTYYLRASVLGGEVVNEISDGGAKKRGFVYAGNQVVAWQESQAFYGIDRVLWEHRDPSNSSFRTTLASGAVNSTVISDGGPAELDPTGANAGLTDPIQSGPPPDGGSLLPYPSFGSSAQQGVSYSRDGIPMPADFFIGWVDSYFPSGRASAFAFYGKRWIDTSGEKPKGPEPLDPELEPDDPDIPIVTIDGWIPSGHWEQISLLSLIIRPQNTPCERRLGGIFSDDPDARFVDVTDGGGYDPVIQSDRTPANMGGEEHNHLYNAQDTPKNYTNVFGPRGGTVVGAGVHEGQNWMSVYYRNLGGASNVILQFWHVENNTGGRPQGERVLLGQMGANGNIRYGSVGSPEGWHVHINAYKWWGKIDKRGRLIGNKLGAISAKRRNRLRLPDLLCK